MPPPRLWWRLTPPPSSYLPSLPPLQTPGRMLLSEWYFPTSSFTQGGKLGRPSTKMDGIKTSKALLDTWDDISEEKGLNSCLTPFSQLSSTGRIWNSFWIEGKKTGKPETPRINCAIYKIMQCVPGEIQEMQISLHSPRREKWQSHLFSLFFGLLNRLLALAHPRSCNHPHPPNLQKNSTQVIAKLWIILSEQERARPSDRWLQRRSSSMDSRWSKKVLHILWSSFITIAIAILLYS